MLDTQLQDLRDRLAAAQAQARRLRCEAFVRYTPIIAGQRLHPLTLERYNHLLAFENPYVTGGPATLEDLCAFVWIMHPDFGQFAHRARRRVLRATLRALQPRTPRLTALARLWLPVLHRRPGLFARLLRAALRPLAARPTAAELLATASETAAHLITTALQDFPTDSAPDGQPLPYALQAQILNLMRRELGLPFAETRHLPLAELAQHLREILHRATEGKAPLMTPAESAVWRDYLAALNPPKS